MPEDTQNATTQEGAAAEARTFTQEEVNAIVEKRVARVKSTPPADYDELKAKAAKFDEAQEAAKSDLERATEAAGKWKAKYEELKAEDDRRAAIDAAAAEYKVDAEMLARMSGDVEENARFLAEKAEAEPKYGDMHDAGEKRVGGMTAEEVAAIKNPAERVRARAQFNANQRK